MSSCDSFELNGHRVTTFHTAGAMPRSPTTSGIPSSTAPSSLSRSSKGLGDRHRDEVSLALAPAVMALIAVGAAVP